MMEYEIITAHSFSFDLGSFSASYVFENNVHDAMLLIKYFAPIFQVSRLLIANYCILRYGKNDVRCRGCTKNNSTKFHGKVSFCTLYIQMKDVVNYHTYYSIDSGTVCLANDLDSSQFQIILAVGLFFTVLTAAISSFINQIGPKLLMCT